MTDLAKFLDEKGIKKAIVIDDMFDQGPSQTDIIDDNWSIFFDELNEPANASTEELISDNYHEYHNTDIDQLIRSQSFITTLWNLRKQNPILERLFREYEITWNREREFLDGLVQALSKLGVTCTKRGRVGEPIASDTDLIFMDLFLDSQQLLDGIGSSTKLVRRLVQNRKKSPPLVVLMSRSSQLMSLRDKFRDEAGLLASTYRVVAKDDLSRPTRLEAILKRLAKFYDDSKQVARFVHAWDKGLNRARKAFVSDLRRLDLSDLGQIQDLLLEFEGQALGEYIIDIADRILQHEVEGESNIIEAAFGLNSITSDKYAAPHLTGSPNLQELVRRTMFLHNERLKLSQIEGQVSLQFGDILNWKDKETGDFGNVVSLVITPTCDLVRKDTGNVTLLFGTLNDLVPDSWSYKPGPVKTVVIKRDNEGQHKWIKWDLKNVKTVETDELGELIWERDELKRIGRLREIYALEIQRKYLEHFGRMGQLATLPASFPVLVSLFYVDLEGKISKLSEEDVKAVRYVGRGQKPESVTRLVLTEESCDAIERDLMDLDYRKIYAAAQKNFRTAISNRELLRLFESGQFRLSGKIYKKDKAIYAAINLNGEYVEGMAVSGDERKAAILINVKDINTEN